MANPPLVVCPLLVGIDQPLGSLFPDRALAVETKGAQRYRPLPQPYAAASIHDREGRTALHWACARGDLPKARQAVLAGSGVNAADGRGWTALMHAVAQASSEEEKNRPGQAAAVVRVRAW